MAEQRKRELIDQLALARDEITIGKERVSHELNPGHQLKKSIQSHPLGWFAGAMTTMTFLGLMSRRKVTIEQPRKRFKMFRWFFAMGFALVKPTLTTLAMAKVKEEAEKRLGAGSLKSMLGGPSQK
ncbi:hypothetical protein V2O64_02545 [Verrucomicrobiaceae bacterium 227]